MPPLVLSDDELQQLQALANSRSLLHSIVRRAQIVLACAAGETNTAIARRMGLTGMTVGKWRKRYRELGLEGLHDELRPGRPRTYDDDKVAEVINRALQTRPPDGSTHKHAKVKDWLAQRPRFHVHYTPIYASWLNQVERWFGLITQKAIRRGSFSSVKKLIAKIEQFVTAYDNTKTPFQWTATGDSILEKLQRLCSRISGTGH